MNEFILHNVYMSTLIGLRLRTQLFIQPSIRSSFLPSFLSLIYHSALRCPSTMTPSDVNSITHLHLCHFTCAHRVLYLLCVSMQNILQTYQQFVRISGAPVDAKLYTSHIFHHARTRSVCVCACLCVVATHTCQRVHGNAFCI